MSRGDVCIFGEVLFDHFPDGSRVLGGAPFNVAWHLQAFGESPRFISRVGDDDEGTAVRSAMTAWGMDTGGLQTDPRLPTGRVQVRFDDGEPQYDIVEPCAYDAIEPPRAPACGLLYHGSLALRGAASAGAAERLRAATPDTVFVDVNLRPPWSRRDRVDAALDAADWVKLNADELAELTRPGDPATAAAFLDRHALRGVVVTRGAQGAEVVTADGGHFSARPVAGTRVVDTVGAGDAFAAVTILGLRRGWPLDRTLERAQVFAAQIVGRRGATVDDPAFYAPYIDQWQLAD